MPDVNIVVAAVDKASGPLKDVSGEVDNLNSKANAASTGGLSALAGALGTAIKVGAATGVAALVGLGGAVAVAGVNFDNMKEQANIAFTTMLGSGQQAKSFLDELQAFAAKTPFEFPDLLMASQRMLAMGFQSKEVLPTLTAIGDAVAGLGGSSAMVDRVTTALGQMQAKGKASGEEMMQLTEAGIPAWEFLAKKIGVDIPTAMEQVSKGAVSADVAIGALVDGMNTKFGGLMAAQSKTFGGLLSTIKDTFNQVSGQVMQPLFEQLTRGLAMIVEWTSSPEFVSGVATFTGWMEKAGQAAGNFFDYFENFDLTMLGALRLAIYDILPESLQQVWLTFIDTVEVTTRFLKGLFTEARRFEDDSPMVSYLMDLADRIRSVFAFVVKAVGDAAKATWNWAERVLPPLVEILVKVWDTTQQVSEVILTMIGSFGKTFMPVTTAIAKFMGFEDVLNAAGVMLAWVAASAIPPLLIALGAFLLPLAKVTLAVGAMRFAWENDLGGIRTFTQNTLEKISDWFFRESGLWKGNWEDTWEYIIYRADRLIRIDLYNLIVGTWAEIKFQVQFHSTIIRDRLVDWSIKVRDTFEGWTRDTIQTLTHWKDKIIENWNKWIAPTLKEIDQWASITESRINNWVIYWVNRFTEWKDDMVERFQFVFDWWATHIDPWIQYGKDIVQGLWDGMKEIWGNLRDWFTGVWGDLTDRFKKFFGIASPSKLFASYGQYIMEGLGQGLAAYASVPVTQLESTVNSLTNQMARLKGAVVQNVFDINNAVSQLKLNPATMLPSMGGTGNAVGVIGGSAGGTLLLGGGINNLPTQTNPVIKGAGTSNGNNFVPLNTEIKTLGSALGTDVVTAQTAAESIKLLGGLTLQTVDLAKAKEDVNKAVESSAKTLNDFIAGIGDFLSGTLTGANKVFSYFKYEEEKAYREGTLKEFMSSETAQTKTQLKGLYQGLQNSIADILGISTSDLNVTGGDSKRLIDRIKQLTSGTNADTNMEFIGSLLQSAVNFRNLSNFGTGAEYFKDILPTDGRLTGGSSTATTNNFNITLAPGATASDDLISTFNLLNSMYGTAAT